MNAILFLIVGAGKIKPFLSLLSLPRLGHRLAEWFYNLVGAARAGPVNANAAMIMPKTNITSILFPGNISIPSFSDFAASYFLLYI